MQGIAEATKTVVLYESPHKIIKTLTQIVEFCGPDRPVSLSREISKKFGGGGHRKAAGFVLPADKHPDSIFESQKKTTKRKRKPPVKKAAKQAAKKEDRNDTT